MPVGVLAGPGWFYYVINSVLDASGVAAAGAFLDNIIVQGAAAHWIYCCEATLRVMRMLARVSFILNLHKCKYLVSYTVVLGFECVNRGICWGKSACSCGHQCSCQHHFKSCSPCLVSCYIPYLILLSLGYWFLP